MENTMEYKGYIGTVEYSEADKVFFGSVIDIDGLVSYEGGNTDELREDFEGAVDDYIDLLAEIQ